MSQKSVFCITTSREQADRIVNQLQTANFSSNDISVLFPDKGTTRDFAHEKNTKAPEGAVAGAGTGGVLGGAMGWIAGIGALAIPGVGPFIAAGPIIAALSGAAVGAARGAATLAFGASTGAGSDLASGAPPRLRRLTFSTTTCLLRPWLKLWRTTPVSVRGFSVSLPTLSFFSPGFLVSLIPNFVLVRRPSAHAR